jgi:hypothetical protein
MEKPNSFSTLATVYQPTIFPVTEHLNLHQHSGEGNKNSLSYKAKHFLTSQIALNF